MKNVLLASAGLALTLSTLPAHSIEAMRCNVKTPSGIYQPVLRIVDQGGHRDIALGTEGLTRKVFYRDRRVLAYLSKHVGVSAIEMPKSVSRVCGSVEEFARGAGNAAPAVAVPVAQPVTVTAEPEVGPGEGEGEGEGVYDPDGVLGDEVVF